MKKYWDHRTSPSTYVINKKIGRGKYSEWKEVFRGTYDDGMMYLASLDRGGLISFQSDYLPAMQKLRKHCKNGYALERTLRREIIKLKKEIKAIKGE
tara:strand:+ start:2194 stop:2484 length:291 start_codon:yes stop_codon:yes gene_type:complete